MSDKTVSSIPHQADWPVSFPLQSTVELVSAWGLHPETIVFRLLKQIGGRIAHNVYSYEKIGARGSHIDILKRGYKPSWISKAPRTRAAAHNPTISALASNVLTTEILGLIEKGTICMVGPVHGQYVSSYFTAPKSKKPPD